MSDTKESNGTSEKPDVQVEVVESAVQKLPEEKKQVQTTVVNDKVKVGNYRCRVFSDKTQLFVC